MTPSTLRNNAEVDDTDSRNDLPVAIDQPKAMIDHLSETACTDGVPLNIDDALEVLGDLGVGRIERDRRVSR